MAVEGVGVEVELGVQGLDVAVAFEDQRVDFRQRGIGFHVAGVEALERIDRLGDRGFRHTDAARQVLGLRVRQTDERIDDAGLHITVDGKPKTLKVDTIVICAGQEPRRELQAPLEEAGIANTLIGGADVAAELDAKRAIDQGTRLAASL